MRFLELCVKVVIKHLNKCPLSPFVVIGLTGSNLAIPVVTESNFVQLLAIASYVFLGGDGRMLPSLDGILLSRKSVRVITHGVKYIKSFQTFETTVNIRGNIAKWMPYVKTCSRWVGEHVQHIKFWFRGVYLCFVSFVLLPIGLPFLFYCSEIVFHNDLKTSKFFVLIRWLTTYFFW